VPTDQSPPEGTSAPSMPPSVRVAVIVMALLAPLLLLTAGLLWIGYDAAVAGVMESGSGVTRAAAGQFVVRSLVANLVLGLLLALAAWFLPRRQAWARWVGLTALVVLGLLTVVQVVGAGGVTVVSLLLLVLTIAAITSLLARPTAEWIPSVRG
jgi:drug/metabolite transporter (DMT)-like permease